MFVDVKRDMVHIPTTTVTSNVGSNWQENSNFRRPIAVSWVCPWDDVAEDERGYRGDPNVADRRYSG